jgi:hypothetical protein
MEIYSANRPRNLVEANVVKPLKAGSSNGAHSVVWNQEVFLPSHEDVLSLRHLGYMKVSFPGLLLKRSKSGEFCPVL